MKPDIWIDGQFVPWNEACLHPLCHSLQRGSTIFDSIDCIKAHNGRASIFRLRDHIVRFENSSRLIGMPLGYTVEDLMNAVIETVAKSGLKTCTIRPLALYSDPVFDVYPGDSHVSVVIGIGEKSAIQESIKMKISRIRKIEATSMPIKAKVSGNYIASMIAKSEAIQEGFDDSIILDRNNYVAEGSTSNIFIVEKGTLITAPGDRILQGITRNTIIALSENIGLGLNLELYSPERLKAADEVFLSSSGKGVLPITQVDSEVIGNGKPGPVTSRLRSYYKDIIMGRVSEFEHWLTYV